MSGLDYKQLGLKAGIEIHQQLDSNKLFCDCPSIVREESPDKKIKRILRASAGETGVVDIAAMAEMEKQKYFVYEYYEDTNCLVELDEEPPHPINADALKTVLQFSKMVNAEPVDQVHVMRKTVVDGSNTSGFQRTALVARNGIMEVEIDDSKDNGKDSKESRKLSVKIDTVCIEEDAARIIERNKDYDIYRLDRLGIPLIEIATGPDMHTPQEVKEVAGYIGMLLRSTGHVKRGLGTIRQDVNVSIKDGARTEIKGVQDLRMLDKVVELEAVRQLRMLMLRDRLFKCRSGISKDKSEYKSKDYSEYFSNTKSKFISKGLKEGQKVYGKSFKGFKGIFGFEINPDRRFGTELSDKIKFLGLNGLIHTDEDISKYNISYEMMQIFSDEKLSDEDSLILILGSEDKCVAAFEKIDDTIQDLIEHGLSKEVRNAKDDGTSSFLRPMPGSSRMYPETDIPVIIPIMEDIEMPELITDKIERFEKTFKLPRQVAKELVLAPDFENFVNKYPQVAPITIAEALDSMPKEIKTRYTIDMNPSQSQYDQIFQKLNIGEIAKDAVFEILLDIGRNLQGEIIDFSKYKTSEDEIVNYITELIEKHPTFNANALMGEVMKKFRGKYPGSKILELIKKFKGE